MKNRSILWASGLAIAALALTACGGPAAPADDDGLTSVRLVVAPIQFETARIAQQQGYFEDHGLDVEIIDGGAPLQNVAMAVSGEADIVTGSWGTAITSNSQNLPMKVIAGNGYASDVVEDAAGGLLVPADSPVQTLADVEGLVIGVQGLNTGSEVPLFVGLTQNGLTPDDVELVELASAAMSTALEEGTVDAVLAADPYFGQMVARGDRIVSSPSEEYMALTPITVWMATDEWLANNAETAQAFVDAMFDAQEFYMDPGNREAVLDVTAEFSQADRAGLDETVPNPVSVAIYLDAAAVQRDGFLEFGIVDSAPETEDLLWIDAPRR